MSLTIVIDREDEEILLDASTCLEWFRVSNPVKGEIKV